MAKTELTYHFKEGSQDKLNRVFDLLFCEVEKELVEMKGESSLIDENGALGSRAVFISSKELNAGDIRRA